MSVYTDNSASFATTREQFIAAHVNEVLNDLDGSLRGYRLGRLDGTAPWLGVTAADLVEHAATRLALLGVEA